MNRSGRLPKDGTTSSAENVQKPNTAARTSSHLIRSLKSKDVDAWNRMVELYSPLVYHWCKKSGLIQQDIPDVFQDVFCSVATHIDKFNQNPKGTFRGWLRTITYNKTIDYFRKTGRTPMPVGGTEAQHFIEQIPTDFSIVDAHDVVSDNPGEDVEIRRDFLKQALANIRPHFSEKTWRAFWRVVIDGRETNDVANELAMNPGTIRVAKSRVLKRLRQEFGDSAGH